jgi:hypothetical protein
VAKDADIVLLGVKPQNVESVLRPLSEEVDKLGPLKVIFYCNDTKPRWPLCALGRRMERSTAWDLSKADCIMRTNSFLSSLFLSLGTRMPHLQIISPDLSVTVFVTLHYLTLTLAAPKRHRLTVLFLYYCLHVKLVFFL